MPRFIPAIAVGVTKLSELTELIWDLWPTADEIASAMETKDASEGATLLNKLDIDFAASIVNSANLSASKAASIFDSANLTESKAESIWHHANLTDARRNSIGPNLTPAGISKVLYFGEEATWKTTASPNTGPRGIGGDSSVIWHCDTDAETKSTSYQQQTSQL